LDQKNN